MIHITIPKKHKSDIFSTESTIKKGKCICNSGIDHLCSQYFLDLIFSPLTFIFDNLIYFWNEISNNTKKGTFTGFNFCIDLIAIKSYQNILVNEFKLKTFWHCFEINNECHHEGLYLYKQEVIAYCFRYPELF